MVNWDPLIMWQEIRGHHFNDMMMKLGALDGAMEILGLFALWWRNGEIANPALYKWPDEENGKFCH